VIPSRGISIRRTCRGGMPPDHGYVVRPKRPLPDGSQPACEQPVAIGLVQISPARRPAARKDRANNTAPDIRSARV